MAKKIFRAWFKNTDGVTAIEFAMVAPVFFGLLLMTIETGIVFSARQLLETSVATASRTVLTGAKQAGITTANTGGDAFKSQICVGMSGLINYADCVSGMMIDMKVFNPPVSDAAIKANLALPSPINQSSMTCNNFGGSNSYMLVRAYYQYPVYVSYLNFAGSSPGHSLIVGTTAMKLEPFSGAGSPSTVNGCA